MGRSADNPVYICLQIPSSQRKRKREGWNYRLWDQVRTCTRTAWSSASTSCRRRGSVCQLLQPAPKWASSRSEHCPAPTPWDRPTPTP
ncbi:RNA binding motif protein 22, isoform CRA_b, partial [Rattus norvegicus]